MKVKIISCSDENQLEDLLNKFLIEINGEIFDIKYSNADSYVTSSMGSTSYYCSAMIILK